MRAVVVGASLAGLTSALALSKEGFEVVILDADDSEPPEDLGVDLRWPRKGIPQHNQAHSFSALFVKTLEMLSPGFIGSLAQNGAILREHLELMPDAVRASIDQLPDDVSDIKVVNARRPFVESMLRRLVRNKPSIELKTPVSVSSLLSRPGSAAPHVTGVVTTTGETIRADAVVDASGRRSEVDRWLQNLGSRPPTFVSEPARQVYFTRHYRLIDESNLPRLNNGFVTVNPFPWFATLMFPGDNATLQIAMGCLPEDVEMKHLRDADAFQRVALMAPEVNPWVDPARSEPITDVFSMGNLNNHLRRLVEDGFPVVTGLHLAGDSAMITNPQYGRGVSHAVGHSTFVATTIARFADDPVKQALEVDAEVERMLVPSFLSSIRLDRMRTRAWREAIGSHIVDEEVGIELRELDVDPRKAMAVSDFDPYVWYALLRSGLVLDPPGSWMFDPEVVRRVADADASATPPSSGPDRETILAALKS